MFTLNNKGRFGCRVCVWKLFGEIKELREASAAPALQAQTSAAVTPE
jgi:hypothetical protein